MSLEPLVYLRSTDTDSAIPELSVVALHSNLVLKNARVLPVDAEGTVVGLWGDEKGYVVEFDEPFHAVATVEADQLREVHRFGP